MKRVLYISVVALLVSCSSSKNTASFLKSNPDYGYRETVSNTKPSYATVAKSEDLVTSTSRDAAIIIGTTTPEQSSAVEDLRKNYQQLNASEKKIFRKELKAQLKNLVNAKRKAVESTTSVTKTKMMDHDLKLAAIFGSIGLVALIISGNVFYIIGGIALIIGVVFFVMWLVRQ